jgi:hypothetical protein
VNATAPRVLEWAERITPLGVRFVDAATGATVSDGLQVTATALGGPPARALPNRAGAYVFPRLAGVPGAPEAPADADRDALDRADAAFWASPPAVVEVRIEVDDALGRYLPCSFPVVAPTAGLLWLPCQSPPAEDAVPSVALHSAPGRLSPVGFAAVRALLWDRDADAPAAWAVLEVLAPPRGGPHLGVAGPDGQVAVFMPYPEPPPPSTSPPPGQHGAMSEQRWPLELSVRYEALGRDLAHPDACTVLEQSPGAFADPAAPSLTAELAFGRELALPASSEQGTPIVTHA